MDLALRSRRDQARVEPDSRGVLRLEGEGAWEVRGPEALVAVALEDLRDVATGVHAEVIHLDFGNTVGVFRVRGLGTIEVASGKWSETHFDAMLADVARIASALPFDAGTAGPLPYDRTLSARDDLLYHAYVYIRHILSDSAPRRVQLVPSLVAVLAEPHRRGERETVEVQPERLRRVDDATVLAIACGAGPLDEVTNRRLPRILRCHLPRLLPERQFRSTTDTPENRFVKAFLDLVGAVLKRMQGVLEEDSSFAPRVRAECRALEARVARFRRHRLWNDVGTMTHFPASSVVLQRRRGYREVFGHFTRLRLATRHLPISAHEARDLLESKDIAKLYEMWCYFRVIDLLRTILGAPENVVVPSRSEVQVHVAHEFEVRWSCGVRALYNATFSPSKTPGRQTYSVSFRPDIVIILADGAVHVLDAKFKLKWIEGQEEDLERAKAKLDDVSKMHAYRDAIQWARSAWVLYPGTEQHTFAPDDGTGGVEGVGAVPLRPEVGGGEALRELLVRILSPA